MARFPRTEAELLQLASRMASGLEEHRQLFPSPPVGGSEVAATFKKLHEVSYEARVAAAAAKKKYAEKEALLQRMKEMLRANVRYAEGQARHDPAKLQLVGWGPRRQKSKARAPGQVLGLEVVEEGFDWVVLTWKKPVDGGAVGAYKVLMGVSNGERSLVESTANTGLRLEKLQRGVTLSFFVVAMNKMGDGIESSTVTAVL